MAPALSVVLISYNHEPYLPAAVKSMLTQTQVDFELIIVDDASTDGSPDIIQSYSTDSRVRIVVQPHGGAHTALNNGIAHSQGPYIAILNSDDIYSPTRLAVLEASAPGGGKDFFAFTGIDFIDDHGSPLRRHRRIDNYWRMLGDMAVPSGGNPFLAGNAAMSSSNFFFSRGLYEKVGPFRNLRYVHDWDWALRATAFIKPVFINQPLLSYRLHPASTLNEQDQWRHMLENAFIFASFLKNGLRSPNNDTQAACRTYVQTLLKNENFLPVLVLFFIAIMASGTPDEEIIEKINSNFFAEKIPPLLAEADIPFDGLLSMNHLSRKLGPINKTWAVFKKIFPACARQLTHKK